MSDPGLEVSREHGDLRHPDVEDEVVLAEEGDLCPHAAPAQALGEVDRTPHALAVVDAPGVGIHLGGAGPQRFLDDLDDESLRSRRAGDRVLVPEADLLAWLEAAELRI